MVPVCPSLELCNPGGFATLVPSVCPSSPAAPGGVGDCGPVCLSVQPCSPWWGWGPWSHLSVCPALQPLVGLGTLVLSVP